MVKLCIKMYASGITSADNVATTIIPINATLVGVAWNAVLINAGAVGSSIWYQLTSMSTSSWANNDARDIVNEFYAGNDKAINFNQSTNFMAILAGIRYNAGDIIRMHRYQNVAPTSAIVSANLYFV